MYDRYHPRARRRLNELASEYADWFDSTIISNAIVDRVPEDEFALALADAVERLTDLEKRANAMEDVGLEQPLQATTSRLTTADTEGFAADIVRERVEIVVADILADLATSVGEWNDIWDQDAIERARQEIRHTRDTGEVFA